MIVPIPVAARVPPTVTVAVAVTLAVTLAVAVTVAVAVAVTVVVTVRKHLITLMHPLQSILSAHIYDILTHDHIIH